MRQKTFVLTFFLAFLLLAVTGEGLISLTSANPQPLPPTPPPIYIRSDGSIEPPSASVERLGDTYVLLGSPVDAIEVQRDNVVIDGNGFALTKPSMDTDDLMTPIGWLPSLSLSGRSNVTVKNILFNKPYTGITVKDSSSITIEKCFFKFAEVDGVVFQNCQNSTLSNNNFVSNHKAVTFLENADHIDIKHNRISGCVWHAIWGEVHNSSIIGNTIVATSGGAALYSIGAFNHIIANSFENNNCGILAYTEDANEIRQNNFIGNTEQCLVEAIWVFEDAKLGNYWSDYTGEDTNGDGIGDTPYIIDTQRVEIIHNDSFIVGHDVQDKYPLMAPVNISSLTVNVSEFVFQEPPKSTPLTLPSPSPSAETTRPRTWTPYPSPEPKSNAFQSLLMPAGCGVVVTVICVVALLFFRKAKAGIKQ